MLKGRLFPATVVFWNDAGIGGPDSGNDSDGGFGGGGNDAGIGGGAGAGAGTSSSGGGESIAANDAGIISGLMSEGVDTGTLASLSGGTGGYATGGIGANDAGIVSNLIATAVLEPDKILNMPTKAFFGGWKSLMGAGLGRVGMGLLSALGVTNPLGLAGSLVAGKLGANALGKVGERKAAQQSVVDALGFNPFGGYSKGFAVQGSPAGSDGGGTPFVSQEQGKQILRALQASGKDDAAIRAIINQLLSGKSTPESLLDAVLGGTNGQWLF